MNPLTTALKSEIARVARKELKDELLALRKVTTAHRSEIAALKRQVKSLTTQFKKGHQKSETTSRDVIQTSDRKLRFSAKGFAAQRTKLGLSAAQMAKLLGVSGLSVYKWESGKVTPRAAQLVRIAAIRKIGKREAEALLVS